MPLLSNADTYNWYPVYTNPRAEKAALTALQKKGITAYLPLQKQLKQWSDRKKWVEEPFLKSYIFVYMRATEQTEVLMIKGISRFIFFSGKIASMPDRQIEELKSLLASPYELEITADALERGESVIVKAGPLKGLIGEMIAYKSRTQLVIRLDKLGYSILVNLAASLIDRLS